jgi:hypothetical protein
MSARLYSTSVNSLPRSSLPVSDGICVLLLNAVDLEEDFVQMPLITGPSKMHPQASGILLAELVEQSPVPLGNRRYSSRSARIGSIREARRAGP